VTRDAPARLLDAAVPPIPVELRLPPYGEIRQRVKRRRQLAIAGCGIAVGVVLVAVSLVVAPSPRPSIVVGSSPTGTDAAASSPTPPPSPAALNEPPAELPANPVPTWRVALIRRSGTDITIYVNPPARCWIYANPTVKVDEGASVVTLTVSGEPEPEECSRTRVVPVTVVLSRPIGGRELREPSGASILIERDNLPAIPGAWWPSQVEFPYLDGTYWAAYYTRPGGPDLQFSVGRGAVTGQPGEEIRLGSHTGIVVPLRDKYSVWWQVGDLTYRMALEPSEGQTSTLDDLHSVVDALLWP